MFKGEYELLNKIEKQYRCEVLPILTYGTVDHIPEQWRAIDNQKLIHSFIEMEYVSCQHKEILSENATIEILPKGRDALQRYREMIESEKYNAEERERSKKHVRLTVIAVCVSLLSLLVTLAFNIILLVSTP